MIRIAHITNPVKVEPDNSSYLYVAQPVTFQTMLNAKVYAETLHSDLQIKLYTVQYPEDREIIPEGFVILPDLKKAVSIILFLIVNENCLY